MSLFNAFKAAGSAMQAQTHRLNAVSSNIANVETAAANPEDVYKPRKVVFQAELKKANLNDAGLAQGVKVKEVVAQDVQARQVYDPKHPLSDDQGYVYMPNINAVEEMVDMIAASRNYQTNSEVMNTAKALMLKTINMGQ